MTAYRRYREYEYGMCNEGIGEWFGNLKKKVGKWFTDRGDEFLDFLDATSQVNIVTTKGIKGLKSYNNLLNGNQRNPWNAARKMYYILDAVTNLDKKVATVSNTRNVEKGIELLRDDCLTKDKNIDPKADRFEFVNEPGKVTLLFHDGNTDDAVAKRAKENNTDVKKPRGRKDDTITLMTIEFKENDNNSLENRRLEWRVARLEHLIEERFGRN